jgi:hypothetical protein
MVVGPCAGGELPAGRQLRPSIIIVQAIHAIFFRIDSTALFHLTLYQRLTLLPTSKLSHTHTAIMVRHAAGRLIHQTAIHTANTLPPTVPPHRPSQRPRPTNRPRPLSSLRPRRTRHAPLQPIPQHTPQRLTRLLSSRLLTPLGSTPDQLAQHPRRPQDDHAASRIRHR